MLGSGVVDWCSPALTFQ